MAEIISEPTMEDIPFHQMKEGAIGIIMISFWNYGKIRK